MLLKSCSIQTSGFKQISKDRTINKEGFSHQKQGMRPQNDGWHVPRMCYPTSLPLVPHLWSNHHLPEQIVGVMSHSFVIKDIKTHIRTTIQLPKLSFTKNHTQSLHIMFFFLMEISPHFFPPKTTLGRSQALADARRAGLVGRGWRDPSG